MLQESRFYRVGGTKEISIDVRVISATNTKIEQLIAQGNFRQDLYYRLNVIPIKIPSLAERKEDLPPLISYYLEKTNARFNRTKTFSPESMEILLEYDWPGNIRELINCIERMVVIVDEPVIEPHHLAEISGNTDLANLTKSAEKNHAQLDEQRLWKPQTSLKELITVLEGKIIEEAVAECGSLRQASQSLGVDVTTLIRKRNRKNQLSCL